MAVARASYVAGCSSTSNVLAGRKYGIPVFGTHAHSWVMSFETELEAFRAFAASSPNNCTLLIDTYDVREGVENAITVAHEMEARGERLAAIRIDSGDLAKLSKYVRGRFDAEGLGYVKISVSNDLDEYTIQSLLNQGAPIDSFGVGTKLATCYDQPALGGVYKLAARRDPGDESWTPVVKLSEQPYKRTIPGVQQVRRYMDEAGSPVCDMIYDEAYLEGEGDARGTTLVAVNDAALVTSVAGMPYRELLVPVVRDGQATGPARAAFRRPRALRRSAGGARSRVQALPVPAIVRSGHGSGLGARARRARARAHERCCLSHALEGSEITRYPKRDRCILGHVLRRGVR